ncbi:hypothetical protein EUTSA_v10015310mg [Eutrema salsugineum]|uniref:Phorbol-ester/DAG-type domain-containing protein n=1 Tax=Eutrema salsugineum TaxID=72664 RepID=V4LH98_EUTSA|nr:hypothetical protein EUTSA_v10015310mg [Eutrema salsugineum]
MNQTQSRKEMVEKTEDFKYLTPNGYKQRCPLSHPTQPHTLSPRASRTPESNCFICGKQKDITDPGYHYHCTTCDVCFHSHCFEQQPRKITHPFHLQHPLLLTFGKHGDIIDGSNILTDQDSSKAVAVNSNFSTSSHPGKSGLRSLYDNCTWCGKYIPSSLSGPRCTVFYRCSICSFCLDTSCAKTNPPLTIENPKCHHHPLVFFPRPLLVPCDACGLVDRSESSYACFQCNYMVHQYCVDLPRVIKITRHPHRLSYSPYLLPPPNSLCRICYKTVDVKYGQYSCKNEDCSYVLHSKCATHVMVWDGKELEWTPEEADVVEDIPPFKKVGDGLIEHFGHEHHHLKLEKYISVRDAKKLCQAKLDHALHNHSVFLDPFPLPKISNLQCSACARCSNGFKYKCYKKGCQISWFTIDVPCCLVPEYSTEKVHEHPLFIAPYNYDHEPYRCNGCKRRLTKTRLQCTLCDFSICYECATIPKELQNKYDEHPLTLCYGEDTEGGGKYWCEECEKEVDRSEWFYTCNKCCITIHRTCLFGFYVYLKPPYTFEYFSPSTTSVEVFGNSSSPRPICNRCEDRCRGSTYFKFDMKTLCSWCLFAPPKR